MFPKSYQYSLKFIDNVPLLPEIIFCLLPKMFPKSYHCSRVPQKLTYLCFIIISGTIRGNSCNRCNLQLQEPNFLPIILHNMSKFDGRLIMSAVGKYGHKNISVLPQSVDTYVSIMIGKCRYLDSKRFLNASLASLVENASSESASFKYLSKFIPEEHLPLFLKKQPFCYDYLDGPEKLTETILPPRAAFFDRLSETEISDSDYEHVQRVWNAMGMRTLQDFLETYLLSDVLLLADVLSIFRKNMMDSFRLDPMHYFSLSGFSFDCALRQTETKIELLTCLEMHQMIENAIRGGLATVGSPRYAKANNPLMPEEEYEPENPTSFMHFYDFNGLYTSVMKNYPLPTFGFRWLSEYELERFDVMSIPASSDHGYIVECDLHYPEELHDMQDSFPLAPEHVRIKPEDLSEYTKKMAEECGISLEALREIKKLCLTLRDKKHYVTHYMSLQFYLKHGLVLTKIHRVIRFTQTPWLEDFMTDAADKRRGSKSKLYQTIFKGIPNSVYGMLKMLLCLIKGSMWKKNFSANKNSHYL